MNQRVSQVKPKFPSEYQVIIQEILHKILTRTTSQSFRHRGKMSQAMEFWKALRDFQTRAQQSLISYQEGHPEILERQWLQQIQTIDYFHIRARFMEVFRTHENYWIQLVVAVETLPTPVFRRWLWHENVDFQGFESFLRRLNTQQVVSLHKLANQYLEWNLEQRFEADYSSLPCFSEGWQNWIMRFLPEKSLMDPCRTTDAEVRYAPKAAMAHDFFGWGLGFKKYSNVHFTADIPHPQSLIFQPTLALKGEEFSVNTESRGVYWWMYSTLRSNQLWRSHQSVSASQHVCFGFWTTFFAWLLFLILSPLALAMLFFESDPTSPVFNMLALVGLVTPSLLMGIGIQKILKIFGSHYQGAFVKYVGLILMFCLSITVIGYHVYQLVHWLDWYEPINWGLMVFGILWLSYMLSEKKMVLPIQLPFFGPVLTLFLANRLLWLGYQDQPEKTMMSIMYVLLGLIGAGMVVVTGWCLGKCYILLKDQAYNMRALLIKHLEKEEISSVLIQGGVSRRYWNQLTLMVFFGLFAEISLFVYHYDSILAGIGRYHVFIPPPKNPGFTNPGMKSFHNPLFRIQ